MKVLFYPDPPVQIYGHSLSKTIKYFRDHEITNDIDSDWDIGVWWNYKDVNKPDKRLIDDSRTVYNLYCNNVTKSYVDRVFTDVFGYSSMADTTKLGWCIKKGEGQATHDGKFVETPCTKEKGYIYQKVLDNRVHQNWIRDIRVPIFCGQFDKIFIKDRTLEMTFDTGRGKKRYKIEDGSKHLSSDEIIKIKEFSNKAGLDLGELDTVRDNSTGLLYIIDVNDIPGGEVFNKIKNGRYWELYFIKYLMKKLRL